jgi:hypothetical protein
MSLMVRALWTEIDLNGLVLAFDLPSTKVNGEAFETLPRS